MVNFHTFPSTIVHVLTPYGERQNKDQSLIFSADQRRPEANFLVSSRDDKHPDSGCIAGTKNSEFNRPMLYPALQAYQPGNQLKEVMLRNLLIDANIRGWCIMELVSL